MGLFLQSLSYIAHSVLGTGGGCLMAYSVMRAIKVYQICKAYKYDDRTPLENIELDIDSGGGQVYCALEGTAVADDKAQCVRSDLTGKQNLIYFYRPWSAPPAIFVEWGVQTFENDTFVTVKALNQNRNIFGSFWNKIFGPRWILPATCSWITAAISNRPREFFLENGAKVNVVGVLYKQGQSFRIGRSNFKPFLVSTLSVSTVVISEELKSLALFCLGWMFFMRMLSHNGLRTLSPFSPLLSWG